MTFKQNLNLGSGGTLQIEIAGNAGPGVIGGHDQIEVLEIGNTIGDLAIDGALEVILLNGFTPNVGDQWTIVRLARNRRFDKINYVTVCFSVSRR